MQEADILKGISELMKLLVLLIIIIITLSVVIGMTSIDQDIDLLALVTLFVPLPR